MKTRKTLQIIQDSAVDKENHGGAGRTITLGRDGQKKNLLKPATSIIEKKNPKTDKITAEDLTTQAEPSAKYWETLAEKRRLALEEALNENRELHERLQELEAENDQCRTLLEESKALIDSLREMLNEDESENEYSSLNSSEVNEDNFRRP